MSMRRRLETLEERAMPRRHLAEAKLRHSDDHRRMREHLGQVAALRRGELDTEKDAEVEAVNAVFEGRLAQIRGRAVVDGPLRRYYAGRRAVYGHR